MINGELLGDASKMKINLLTALHFIAEAWRQINTNHHTELIQEACIVVEPDGEYNDVSNDILNEQAKDYCCSLHTCPVMPM